MNIKVIWDLLCIHFEHSLLAYNVPQYPYHGQSYAFLTKHDHCVCALMTALFCSWNMWNNFHVDIYYQCNSWSKFLSLYCQLCGRCNIKSYYLFIDCFICFRANFGNSGYVHFSRFDILQQCYCCLQSATLCCFCTLDLFWEEHHRRNEVHVF